jgi:hypothetical protein
MATQRCSELLRPLLTSAAASRHVAEAIDEARHDGRPPQVSLAIFTPRSPATTAAVVPAFTPSKQVSGFAVFCRIAQA